MSGPTGDPHWWSRAACFGQDTEVFYPPDNARGRRRESYVNVARTICAPCEVKLECLADALNNGEEYGIFGSCDMEKLHGQTQRAALQQWVADQLTKRSRNGHHG